MSNPYIAPRREGIPYRRHRGVLRYAALAILLTSLALTLAVPGILLLTQSYRIFPSIPTADGFVVNGKPIATSGVAMYLLAFAGIFFAAAVGFTLLAFSNHRKNAGPHSDESKNIG